MFKSLENFKSSFRTELSRPNRFDVYLFPPPGLYSEYNMVQLAYRCEAAQLPGRTFATTDQRTYGPVEKFPYLTTYNDLDLTFIVSGDMEEKYFFDNWFEYINPKSTNNYKYKEDYSTDLLINQYDLSNRLTYSARIIQAYPISINQLDLDWSTDGYHKLIVTFAYTRWEQN
jgi:hypothetical protein